MRSRAVLLPTPCDPFLLKYWLENYAKYYKDEVDKLYVCLNSSIEKEVIEYEQKLLERYGASFVYIDHQIEHGDAIKILLEMCKEEYVMLVEDDAYVFKKGHIDSCFKHVEDGEVDCVGSKRGSCAFEILEEAKRKWGVDYEGLGDHGCNFWPCFFFCKTQTLLDTDRHFKAKAWEKGEVVEPLNYVMKETGYGDTFVNTSLILRSKGLKFLCLQQYHGSPEDLVHWEKRQYLWNGLSAWTHVGSLSSGVGGVLVDDRGISLSNRKICVEPREFKLAEAHIDEWARRIQWWQTFYDNSDPNEICEFREEYRKALDRIYALSGVHRKTVLKRQKAYKELGL
ncbi:hypothetical protein KKB83_04215 [Patescibacteria group bacterium]|nr:hypothetical protein [Patescibacteria group bacterium]